ncbi:hypothetical protein NHX12_014446 [Muraenolepis orangiensis]|uniref:Uncharacterized protein n=1 Tax=Muraenolepis orangiensis TaxID=630683 RepID=A0A9Q0DCH5_9TELE|nr:hypothetical protein NHX12_014446 [Muraenolepis orangiensis]
MSRFTGRREEVSAHLTSRFTGRGEESCHLTVRSPGLTVILVLEPMLPLVLEPVVPLVLEPGVPLVLEPVVPLVLEPVVPLVLEPVVPLASSSSSIHPGPDQKDT